MLSAMLLGAQTAEACGGTFCDNTATPMPVDQRGEDILFVQDGPDIEVHVRIQYTGEAERFAWLVPLQAIPDISVGSDALFAELGDATAPRWRSLTTYECSDEEPFSTTGGFVPDSDAGSTSEPDVVEQAVVGAFEVVVLQGGTAAGVVDFLAANNYAQDPVATPILQQYLDEGFLFAAVKLTADADVGDIHPLVFRMAGDEPCVPLRLTAIAAEDDMGVRAYFLGQERWAPLNYAHVVLNPLAFPWAVANNIGIGRTLYLEQLSAAVDLADGRGFVTDYAGSPDGVKTWSIYDQTWDENAFIGVDPIQAIELIAIQGLNRHPLIQGLLMQYIPPPDGIPPTQFWNNIWEYQDQIDLAAWDSAAFAAALSERIIVPALHAIELLETWPYLTRLQTVISPHEMTLDPVFVPAPMLPEQSNELTTNELDLCGYVGSRFSVPWEDGNDKVVCLDEGNPWPQLLREHPALRIEQIPMMGPPQVEQDFSEEILANYQTQTANSFCDPGSDPTDGDPTDGDNTTTDGNGNTSGGLDENAKAGCACGVDQAPSRGGLGFGLLALAGLAAARTRRRRHA